MVYDISGGQRFPGRVKENACDCGGHGGKSNAACDCTGIFRCNPSTSGSDGAGASLPNMTTGPAG